MTIMPPKPPDYLEKKVDDLASAFNSFCLTYELDMRGNKDVADGNVGIVGAIREIQKYPSILSLLVKHPLPTITTILSILLLTNWLSDTILKWLVVLGVFRLPLP